MIARLLLQNTILTAAMGALLFAAAGTLHWPGAWVLLITSVLLGPLCGWWLERIDPALLAERLRPVIQKDQPAADKAFMVVFIAVMLAWLIGMGLDRRHLASDMPRALQAPGLVLLLASTLFIATIGPARAQPVAIPDVFGRLIAPEAAGPERRLPPASLRTG
ncbi:hypothetical protein [Bradyrhizobium sp. McL0616]|uniref:hypothetical protein n=1 Tax=Bradyrhizobium sp. McL0616 TaxID=3415674 RepID=UPI003CF2DF8D